MAELSLTVRRSESWPDSFEAVTASGRILAVGKDISRMIAIRATEEFPRDTALTVTYRLPAEEARHMPRVALTVSAA